MRYAGILWNDFTAAKGVCVTLFVQGCSLRCSGCHNESTWDFNGGEEFTEETLNQLILGLTNNNVHRDFCIMGGEPLAPENKEQVLSVVNYIKTKLPDTKIYLWTGFLLENLNTSELQNIDCIIDGPYIEEERDITLFMRGSRNQRVLYKGKDY